MKYSSKWVVWVGCWVLGSAPLLSDPPIDVLDKQYFEKMDKGDKENAPPSKIGGRDVVPGSRNYIGWEQSLRQECSANGRIDKNCYNEKKAAKEKAVSDAIEAKQKESENNPKPPPFTPGGKFPASEEGEE